MSEHRNIQIKDVLELTLSNGIKILLKSRKKTPLATFQIWYRVGSRNEQIGKTGISHVLEHMMFKGTDKVGPEEFSKLIQREGGQANAFTAKDVTAYYCIMSAKSIPLALDLERDRLLNLRLRKKDFEPELKVVMEERRLRTDTQPEGLLSEEVDSLAYQNHSYRWPIVGWMEDLEGLRLEDVKRYRKEHYIPSNMLLVAVGDIDSHEMMERLEEYFGDIPEKKPNGAVSAVEPCQRSERRLVLKRQAQVPFMLTTYHAPNIGHPDAYALEVLAALLAGGRSAVLHRKLVHETALAIDVGVDYSLLSIDPGLFTISARVLPGKSPSDVEKIVNEELDEIRAGKIDPDALMRAKKQLEALFVFSMDNLLHQALHLAQYEIIGGWRLIENYLPEIQAVRAEDLGRVMNKYMIESNRTVGWLIPEKKGMS